MKKLFVASLVLAVMTSCTTSKRISEFIQPELVAPESSLDLNVYQEKYGQYDGVYIYNETTIEHYGTRGSGYNGIGASWKFIRIHRSKLLVFDPEIDWMTSFRLYTKPAQMYIRITTPDGRVRNYGVEDLTPEKSLRGYDWYTLVYPDIVPGTIIEEGYEINYSVGYFPPPLDHDIELQFTIPCERLEVTFACPDWWTVAIKKLGVNKDVPIVWNDTLDPGAKKQMFSYKRTNIPAVTKEPFAPFFKEVADYLQFQVTELEMKGASLRLPKTWQDFSKNFQKYALKKQGKGWEDVRDRAREITTACTTNEERVDAIVAFVRDSIELDREGFDGNYPKVLDKRLGNSVEKCGLVQKMLEHLNIPATLILVHSASQGYFDPDYISHEQFEAPAVRAQIDGEECVLFPYVERLPINHVPPMFQDQKAMQIIENLASVWQVPSGNRAENSTLEDYDITITETGSLVCREARTANGSLAYDMREDIRKFDETEMKDFVRGMLAYQAGDVTIDSFTIHDLEAYKQPLVLEVHYTIDNLVTITPDEVLFQTVGLFFPFSRKGIDRSPEERVNPISIAYDSRFEKAVTIHFPEKWTTETVFNDVQHENLFGSLTGTYTVRPGEISIHQRVSLNRALEGKETIVQLQELLGERSKLQIPTIVFSVPPEQES